MKLVYLDESESDDLKRTSVAACAFQSDKALAFRVDLLRRLREVFDRPTEDATPFPALHARNLPAGLSERRKIELVRAVYASIAECADGIGRVGHSWNLPVFTTPWISRRLQPALQARGASLIATIIRMFSGIDEPTIFFLEDGFSQKTYIEKNYDLDTTTQSNTQLEMLSPGRALQSDRISGLLNVVGTYYSRKGDLLQASSDFVAYGFHLSDKERRTSFQEEFLDAFQMVRELVKFDDVD